MSENNSSPAADAGPRQPSDPNIICRERLKKLSFLITGNDYAFFSANPQIEEALKMYAVSAVCSVPQEAADTKWNDEMPRDNRFHDPLSSATAPDEAMRVAANVSKAIAKKIRTETGQYWPDAYFTDTVAALIREVGSERERRLEDALRQMLSYVERRGDAAKLLAVGKASRLLGGESK